MEIQNHKMTKSLKIPKKDTTEKKTPTTEQFEVHFDAFNIAEEHKCKVFPITLEGNVRKWFMSLIVNLIIGSKRVNSFYELLKEAQYVTDTQNTKEAFNLDLQQGHKEQDQGHKGNKKVKEQKGNNPQQWPSYDLASNS